MDKRQQQRILRDRGSVWRKDTCVWGKDNEEESLSAEMKETVKGQFWNAASGPETRSEF